MHIGCVHTECALNQVMTEDQLLVAAFRFGPSREKEKVPARGKALTALRRICSMEHSTLNLLNYVYTKWVPRPLTAILLYRSLKVDTSIFDHRSSTIDHRSSTFDLRLSIFDHRSSIIDLRPSIFEGRHIDLRSSIIDLRSSIFDHRPSTIDLRPSTIDHRSSTIDLRPSIFASTFDHRQSIFDHRSSIFASIFDHRSSNIDLRTPIFEDRRWKHRTDNPTSHRQFVTEYCPQRRSIVSAFDLRRSMRRLSKIDVSTFEDRCVALRRSMSRYVDLRRSMCRLSKIDVSTFGDGCVDVSTFEDR